jgi:energy-coupling factor transporter ATP-binding protein EcfA2
MPTAHSHPRGIACFLIRISLVTLLLGSCSRPHQLGMEDDPQEILDNKLRNPEAVLTPDQSITLLNHCAELGEQNAAHAANKIVTMVVGNTGAGKSTTLNALLGCQMKAVRPRELGLPGVKRIVIVDPESSRKEVMPIGHHGRQSQTFLPQIVQNPDNPNSAYCDCPGFSDTRGAEINIANAINIRKILQQATGVKAVFLTQYSDLIGSRGNNIRAMESVCHQMFSGIKNLRRYQNSVLLGITKAPLYEEGELVTKNMVRGLLTDANSDIATILANRIFLFDPLDRATDNLDFWHREQLRTVISQLRHIPQQQAKNLFQTTLTDGDQVHLLDTVRQLRPKMVNAITQGDIPALGQHWQLLQRLKVVEHPEVDQLIEGAVVPAINMALRQLGDMETWTKAYNFDQAEAHIALLTQLIQQLPGATLDINPDVLRQHLARCREQYEECKRCKSREEEIRRLREEMATKQMELETRIWMEESDRDMRRWREKIDREMRREWERGGIAGPGSNGEGCMRHPDRPGCFIQ